MVVTKRCAWGTCKNDSRYLHLMVKNKNDDPVHFVRFPTLKKFPDKRQRWIVACHRGDSFVCSKDSYICSLHFVEENGPTSEHPDPVSAIASKEQTKRFKRKRRQLVRREPTKKRSRLTEEKETALSLLMLSNFPKSNEEFSIANILVSLGETVYLDDTNEQQERETQAPCTPQSSPRETSTGDKLTDNNDCSQLTKECGMQTTLLAKDISLYSNKALSDSKKLRRFLFMQLVEDKKKTYHYTGLSKGCLDLIYNTVKEKANTLSMWKGFKTTRKNTGTQKLHKKYIKQKKLNTSLTVKEQLVFTLVRLRHCPTLVILCDWLGISTGNGSKIFITWVLFLEKELGFLINFASLSDMEGIYRPECYQKLKNLRVIIDCTELYIDTPSRPSSQRNTYSQYKSTNTFKVLVSQSPICHFNFVSHVYSGSISDKEIVRRSGFLNHLEEGDIIMADKGFNIQDLLAVYGVRLMAPPMMTKGKISARASTSTRRIATSRVHIERMIRKLKVFKIMRRVLPLTFKAYISSIVRVVALLVNLQPSVIAC